MKCQFCENEVPPNANNCPSCGAPAPRQFVQSQPAPQHSWQSGYQPQMQPGIQSGTPCGTVPESTKSRVVYILLGLFLGGFGIHNFYAGRTGCGIMQLLITLGLGWLGAPLLLVGVWVIIELFVVHKDGRGQPFC